MPEDFLYEKAGLVTTITFNRPERRNCMNRQVMTELEDLLRDVRNDREVRVLIVTGAGTAFSAGADMTAAKGLTDPKERMRAFSEHNSGVARMVGRTFDHVSRLDCMTIAAVNGHAVGGGWALAAAFDFVVAAEEAEFWVPFYLFLLVFITLNFKIKGCWWAVSLIMTAIIGDLVSSHWMKNLIFRLRPCQDPAIADNIRILANYCPVSSSFTSSHACNHFALATFIFLTLRHTSRWWGAIFAWAFFVAYAQVYVGVHYPIDVAGGALLGTLIGLGTSHLFRLQFGTLHLQPNNHSHA